MFELELNRLQSEIDWEKRARMVKEARRSSCSAAACLTASSSFRKLVECAFAVTGIKR